MLAVRLVVVALVCAALGACVTIGGQPGARGTGTTNAALPPPVAQGGVLNNAIGANLDEADRRRAVAAEIAALEEGGPGTPVGWRGDNGVYGTVIAGPAYSRAGFVRCRDFTHTIFVQNRPQLARGAACRAPEGGWTVVRTDTV
ncbi:hypothetical protein [Aquabacter spiritensis]|uniref:Surface antigen n=1 Tax=Aquabacter spiritensis TaxID=933073 RepID=A0A4R3M8D2_9HYPH|nr:hypothetical protein [Aquabacter spiritensis]TCT07605.1 surface antigen [Aquabacter spiritensis]